MDIQFTTEIFKEGEQWIAHTRELDVCSCPKSVRKDSRLPAKAY